MLTQVVILLVGISLGSCFRPLNYTLNVKVGDKTRLPCRVPKGTPEAFIQWYLGTKQLTRGMYILHYANRLQLHKPAPDEMTLIIKSVVKSDEAVFQCKSHDTVFSTITVHVQWKPEIIEKDSSRTQVTKVEGESAELTCAASGQPQPNITWYRRPQDDPQFRPIGVTGHKLTIRDITRYGGDVYMCNASNVQGHATWEMNVTVHFQPTVYIYETDMEATNGQVVIMTCVVQGSPLYKFYWKFQGTIIEDNWKYMIRQDHDVGYPVYFLTLMIRPGTLGDYDYGTYICHADGSGTEVDAKIQLMKKKPRTDTGEAIHYEK